MEHVPVAEALALPDRRKEIAEIKAGVDYVRHPMPPRLREELSAMAEDLTRLADLAARGRRETNAVRELQRGGRPVAGGLAALEQIDSDIQTTGSRRIVSFLLQPLIRKIMETEDRDVLERSLELYREIERSSLYHRELLRKTMDRAKEFSAAADLSSGKGNDPNH
jgi:hypothetical protein